MQSSSFRNTLKYIIYNGIASTSMFALVGGPVIVAYAMLLGASPIHLGLIGNIEYISFCSYFIASYLINKGYSVRKISIKFSLISRFFYLIIAMLAFFQGCSWVVNCLLLSLFMCNLIGSIAGGVFYPWMKSLLPTNILASFFAERFRWITVTGMVFSLLTATYFHVAKKYYYEHMIYTYSVLFFLAFLLGIICVYTFTRIQDVEMKRSDNNTFMQKINLVLRNKSVIFMSCFLGMISFSGGFVLPFVTVYLLKMLNFTMPMVILLALLSNIIYVLFTKFIARKIKKIGCLPMIMLGLCVSVLSLLCVAGCVYFKGIALVILLLLSQILSGIARLAIDLGANNIQLIFVPKNDSSIYIAVINFVKACFATMAGVLSGIVLTNLEQTISNQIISWTIFWAIGIICFICVFFFALLMRRVVKC